jgi:CheY-like chemotaxis protein
MNGKRILVVNANVIHVRALSAKLQAAGYGVLKALDGSEAIGAVRKEKPDLIVVDTTFPPDVAHGGGVAWDGLLIIEWLHRMDEAQGTPVILICGNDTAQYQKRSLANGVVATFQKPVDNDQLLAAIQSTLNAKS